MSFLEETLWWEQQTFVYNYTRCMCLYVLIECPVAPSPRYHPPCGPVGGRGVVVVVVVILYYWLLVLPVGGTGNWRGWDTIWGGPSTLDTGTRIRWEVWHPHGYGLGRLDKETQAWFSSIYYKHSRAFEPTLPDRLHLAGFLLRTW